MKDNIESTKKVNDEEKYKLILEHCQEDCRKQDERKINTDTKTSYMLVFAAFLLGILLNKSVFKDSFSQYLNNGNVNFIGTYFTIGLIYLAAITLCIISIFLYVMVLINRKYEKIDTELFNLQDLEDTNYIDIEKGLIRNYYEITKINSKINSKVVRMYGYATVLLLISLFFSTIVFLLVA